MNPNNNYNSQRHIKRRTHELKEAFTRAELYAREHSRWINILTATMLRICELQDRVDNWTSVDVEEFKKLQRYVLEADWRQR